jgi:hypothetical protein
MSEYDTMIINSNILYLDANNLYAFRMGQYLPISNFQRKTKHWNESNIKKLKDGGDTDFLFEKDLSYLKK